MESVNVSGLKNNPTEALRKARKDIVVVMNRDHPEAVMVSIEKDGLLDGQGVRLALATALFRDGNMPLARAARLARFPLVDFIGHLSRLGIPVVRLNAEETTRDMETLDAWLALS